MAGGGGMRKLLAVRAPETASMHTSDGARLDADVWRPEGPGEYPVLLMRQPYGRRIASTVVYAHPSWYAANGYIVAVQDVRGRGTSEGRFRLFADDVADGGEAVAWAANLPGSTGKAGMYGFSYQGHTQLLALAAGRPELRALCPGMATWDVREDWAYEGGAFAFLGNLYWGLQMGAEQARLAGDAEAFQALHAASRAPPLHSLRPCWPDVLETFARYSHYRDWLENPAPGPYWESLSVGRALEGRAMDVPMLHFGGWHDFMLRGTLRIFQEARARSRAPQRLVVGPWTHLPWGRRVGAMDFGPEARGFVDLLQMAWFDRFLKDIDNGADREPPVRLFDLIAKRWRDFDDWPRPAPRAFHTDSDGLAATSESGRLRPSPPASIARDAIVHDPWRPAPALGGHNAELGGMRDRSEIDERPDVLTYETEPFAAPATLAGEVELTLEVHADQPSFDVAAVLSHVDAMGRAFNLTQGHRRVEPGEPAPVRIEMRALLATVPAGGRLRLSLAGAAFPAFAVNPGTGAAPGDARLIDNRVITLFVTSGGQAPTRLWLPILD
jgi:putative CocE/NonD family hydrolase